MKVNIEFDITGDGVQTNTAVVLFDGKPYGCLDSLDLSLSADEPIGSFKISAARNVVVESLSEEKD